MICGLLIVGSGLYGLALIPAIPALIGHHAVLLELLNGSIAAIVTAGANARIGKTPLEVALHFVPERTATWDHRKLGGVY